MFNILNYYWLLLILHQVSMTSLKWNNLPTPITVKFITDGTVGRMSQTMWQFKTFSASDKPVPYQIEFSPSFHLVRFTATEISLAMNLPQMVRILQELLHRRKNNRAIIILLLTIIIITNNSSSSHVFVNCRISAVSAELERLWRQLQKCFFTSQLSHTSHWSSAVLVSFCKMNTDLYLF